MTTEQQREVDHCDIRSLVVLVDGSKLDQRAANARSFGRCYGQRDDIGCFAPRPAGHDDRPAPPADDGGPIIVALEPGQPTQEVGRLGQGWPDELATDVVRVADGFLPNTERQESW